MFKCDWLKKKATKSGTSEDWEAYRTQRNLVNEERKLTKNNFYQRQITEASGNQRAAWKIVKQLIGKETGSTKLITELKNDSGLNLTEPGDVANSLNRAYCTLRNETRNETKRNETKREAKRNEIRNDLLYFAKRNEKRNQTK